MGQRSRAPSIQCQSVNGGGDCKAIKMFEFNSISGVQTNSFFVAVVAVEEPEFTEIIENITVPAGRNVKLACSVKNLGSYKVSKEDERKCPLFGNKNPILI